MSARRNVLFFGTAGLLASALGCVEGREPPVVALQAEIPYGPRVYLVDNTLGVTPVDDWCTRLGPMMTGTTTTATIAITGTDGVVDGDGDPKPIDSRFPHNCYVTVKPKTLRVDQIEVTNELFQICVDSGACSTPDPSKASKGQSCESEDSFDVCPVVEVTQTAAKTFCEWTGRRLPSGLEHFIMRQGSAGSSPTDIPVYPTGERAEDDVPTQCNEGILGPSGCDHAAPLSPTDGKGAAQLDVVNGSKGQVYDLMGNTSEWASDLVLPTRGSAQGMPWFCAARLLPTAPGTAPECPTGSTCVRGQFQPPGLALGDYPVCIAHGADLRPSGSQGTLFGGSFAVTKIDRFTAGVFSRRIEPSPDKSPAPSYGFRCAGEIGVDDAVEAE
jgi:hypothetical protein